MIKRMIPQYEIDDDSNEKSDIEDNLYFCANPYLHEISVEHQKALNSLLSNERIYTEKMIQNVISMLLEIEGVITKRLENILVEIKTNNIPEIDDTKPRHPYRVLHENYVQQLKSLEGLKQIFKL